AEGKRRGGHTAAVSLFSVDESRLTSTWLGLGLRASPARLCTQRRVVSSVDPLRLPVMLPPPNSGKTGADRTGEKFPVMLPPPNSGKTRGRQDGGEISESRLVVHRPVWLLLT